MNSKLVGEGLEIIRTAWDSVPSFKNVGYLLRELFLELFMNTFGTENIAAGEPEEFNEY
jgi:hypothetical protein